MPPKKTGTKRARAESIVQPTKETVAAISKKARGEPEKDATVENTTVTAKDDSPPNLIGKFDMYGVTLPFLQKHYVLKTGDPPQFEAVYKEILKFQAKPDFSGRCVLGSPGEPSRFRSPAYYEPFEEEPYEIVIEDIKRGVPIEFSKAESAHLSTVGTVIGLEGVTELASETCGIESATGVFKMRRMWRSKEGAELFECWVTLDVVYGPLFSRKGFGSGADFQAAFWAVRALKDEEGQEIGLNDEEDWSA